MGAILGKTMAVECSRGKEAARRRLLGRLRLFLTRRFVGAGPGSTRRHNGRSSEVVAVGGAHDLAAWWPGGGVQRENERDMCACLSPCERLGRDS
jgi:hypothetical protein